MALHGRAEQQASGLPLLCGKRGWKSSRGAARIGPSTEGECACASEEVCVLKSEGELGRHCANRSEKNRTEGDGASGADASRVIAQSERMSQGRLFGTGQPDRLPAGWPSPSPWVRSVHFTSLFISSYLPGLTPPRKLARKSVKPMFATPTAHSRRRRR